MVNFRTVARWLSVAVHAADLFQKVTANILCYRCVSHDHSRATMLQATSHSHGARQNSTLRNFVLPGPIIFKLDMIDYVGDLYSYANFRWIRSGGEFPENTWNLTSPWLSVVSLFSCTSLKQKPVNSPISPNSVHYTIDGSKRVKSGKDVPFGVFVK